MGECTAGPPPSPSRLKVWTRRPYTHCICSVLCWVWTTLSSWNHFRGLGYKDENPPCSLQLLTEQWGEWVSPLTVGSSSEASVCTAWADDHLPWWDWARAAGVSSEKHRLWGHSFFCLISHEVAVKGCVENFYSQRPLIQHRIDYWLIFKRQGIWGIL